MILSGISIYIMLHGVLDSIGCGQIGLDSVGFFNP